MLSVLWITVAFLRMSYSGAASGLFGPIPEPVCGQIAVMMDSCFNNTTPPVSLDLLYTVKIPDSMEDVSSRCLLFNRGMACVENYLDRCVSQRNRRIVENEVYGAKRLYEYLCHDPTFQHDFLKHKMCFHFVHEDWDTCSDQYLDILREEMPRPSEQSYHMQYVHFCCARFTYERCVHTSALLKCNQDSAIFLQKVAKLLSSETNFLTCDRIDHARCSTGKRVAVGKVFLMILLLLILERISQT
ncbi:uncharacterized protein LOC120428014 [Culex pipiens pallens]|uniref:uncharacterized protein LOC120428014 n=1 Tax=Culex pipiens pallens TaxID=42434 RepID=UPI001953AE64|nr:uncharacterized protein LOC120428014 [Culex pipiens pallens]